MSLPSPSTSAAAGARGVGKNLPFEMSAKDQEMWDSPLTALAQRSGGDLRLLLYSLFSFLHRKTDFYMVPSDDNESRKDGTQNKDVDTVRKMGFNEGDAEKLLLAAFRQFPLVRVSKSKSKPKSNSNSGLKTNSNAKQTQPSSEVKSVGSVSAKKAAPTDTGTHTNTAASHTEHLHQPQKQQQQQQQQHSAHASDDKYDDTDTTDKNNSEKDKDTNSDEPKEGTDNGDSDSSNIRYSEDGKQIPIGNGGSSHKHSYKWTQTIHEASIALPLPNNTRARDLNVVIKSSTLSVSFKNKKTTQTQTPQLLEGQLTENIRTDESTWTIEGGVLLITLDKIKKTWWEAVLQGHETIDTALIDSKRQISEYDDATQGMIRKILFDQRQERLGLPNSEQLLAQSSPLLEQTTGAAGVANLLGTDRASMPPLPPGVEYIDKSNFPPNK